VSGQRVARSRARRFSSAAGAVCGVNGSGRGGASGMGRTLLAAPRCTAHALSRRPSRPPAYPKRAAWAAGTPRVRAELAATRGCGDQRPGLGDGVDTAEHDVG
jgi:hypothetical protein